MLFKFTCVARLCSTTPSGLQLEQISQPCEKCVGCTESSALKTAANNVPLSQAQTADDCTAQVCKGVGGEAS